MKYFFVDAFFIKPGDVWGTNEEIARVNDDNIVTFIATKTIGGYREIKTGRFIPKADLVMHTTAKRPYHEDGHVYMDKKTVRELGKAGAVLVTCSHYKDPLVRPVTDLEDVKEYLEKDVAKETFEKLDEIKKKGLAEYKEERKEKRIEKMESAAAAVVDFKDSVVEAVRVKKEEADLSKNIKKEIKKKR